jgi:transcriptional regulator with XRE-family HTH domain
MPFATTFTDLRQRRRIPMRFFSESVGIRPSYIHEIEKNGSLPSPEKLELLASVFVKVAAEQGAADPEEDARLLFHERELTALTSRLGFDDALAEAVVSLRELDEKPRTELAHSIQSAAEVFKTFHPQVQSGLTRHIEEIVDFIVELEPEAQGKAALRFAEAIQKTTGEIRAETRADPAPASTAERLAADLLS